MKKIVLEKPENTIVFPKEAITETHYKPGLVIAYMMPASGCKAAILIRRMAGMAGKMSGFVYISQLLADITSERNELSLKFIGSTPERSIELALNAGRDVRLYESYDEFFTALADSAK